MSPALQLERPAPATSDGAAIGLAPGVIVHPQVPGGATGRLVELSNRRLARVGDDVGVLLDLMASHRAPVTPERLADQLGSPWTPQLVAETERRLSELGITGAGLPGASPRRMRRIEYSAPLSLQLTLIRPSQVIAPDARPRFRALTGSWLPLVAILVAAAGVPVVAAALAPSADALHTPADLSVYVLVMAGLLATVAVHEAAHGAVLVAHGGRPRRFGFMFFYLLPGFFCDVSDAWRLAPHARVRVALAGIVVQCAIAGLAALGSLVAGGDVGQGLVFFALLSYLYGVANLLPFLKLDGYIALAGGLDLPHLRRKAMADFHSWLAHVLLGARDARQLPGVSWARWFGAGCSLMPVLVVGFAIANLGPTLLPLGVPGAVLVLLLVATAAGLLLHAVIRFIRHALACGAGPLRMLLAGGLVTAAMASALVSVQVPHTVHGGYATVGGAPSAVVAVGIDTGALASGAPVDIRRNGLLPGSAVGTAVVTGAARPCEAPLGSLVPVRDERHPVRAQCLPLRITGAVPDLSTGRLRVRLPDTSVADRLAGLFVRPSLDVLGIGG